MQIKFYTGPQCSLCDDAKSLLQRLPNAEKTDVEYINIRTDTQLYHLYGARIPVIKRTDNNAELGWPFDFEGLKQFLNE